MRNSIPGHELVVVGVTFSMMKDSWPEFCQEIKNCINRGCLLTIIFLDFLSPKTRSMSDPNRHGVERLISLLSTLKGFAALTKIFVVDFPLYSSYFYFKSERIYRYFHQHGQPSSQSYMWVIPPENPDYRAVECEIQYLQTNRECNKVVTEEELQKEIEALEERKNLIEARAKLDKDAQAYKQDLEDNKLIRGNWVLYVDGKFIAQNEHLHILAPKVVKNCYLVQVPLNNSEAKRVDEVMCTIQSKNCGPEVLVPVRISRSKSEKEIGHEYKLDTGSQVTTVTQEITVKSSLFLVDHNYEYSSAAGTTTTEAYLTHVHVDQGVFPVVAPRTERPLLGTDLLKKMSLKTEGRPWETFSISAVQNA